MANKANEDYKANRPNKPNKSLKNQIDYGKKEICL